MKNNFKLGLISVAVVMALFVSLQLPSYADAKKHLEHDIAALTKEPVSKKKVAYKFLMAMLGVAASSVLIYVGLSAYNKIFKSQAEPVVGLNSIRRPETFKESINLFLEKTNWD